LRQNVDIVLDISKTFRRLFSNTLVKRKPIKQRKKLRKRNKLIAIESYSLNQDFNPSLEEGRNLLPSFHEKYTARTIVDHQ